MNTEQIFIYMVMVISRIIHSDYSESETKDALKRLLEEVESKLK